MHGPQEPEEKASPEKSASGTKRRKLNRGPEGVAQTVSLADVEAKATQLASKERMVTINKELTDGSLFETLKKHYAHDGLAKNLLADPLSLGRVQAAQIAQWYGAGVDSWLSRVRIPSQALLKKKYIKCQKQKMNHRGLPHTRGYERDLVISVNIPIRRLSAWGGGGHRCWCRMKSALSIKAQHRRGPAAASGRTSWHIRYCPCFRIFTM